MSSEAQPDAKPKSANSYYYWHNHEKERAKVGDVAPMPKPLLVKKDDSAVVPEVAQVTTVSKYSWCDGEKSVSIYLDTVQVAGETVKDDSLQVEFTNATVDVRFTSLLPNGTQRQKHFAVELSKKIKADASTYRLKPTNQNVFLKLVKREETPWFELAGKATEEKSDSDEAAPEDD